MAEAAGDILSKETAPPPKKKSLFNTSWRKPVAQKEGIDFFSRADELWPSRLAEEERKRQKKAAKLERKRSTASAERKATSPPDSKRRRVSQNGDHERHSSEGSVNYDDPDEASWTHRESTLSTPGSRKSNSSSQRKAHATPVSERHSRDIHAKDKEQKSDIHAKGYISLSDSDQDGDEAPRRIHNGVPAPINLDDNDDVIVTASKPAVGIEEDSNVSDEEFPELARRAREREKERILERAKGSKKPVDVFDDVFDVFGEQPVIPEDPIIKILITSRIEGTEPLVVRMKLSQKLKTAKLAWCDKQSRSAQPLSKPVKDSIFLAWKGIKLYDYTSCKGLGLKIDGRGDLTSTGEGFIRKDDETKVHFEAWTPDLWDQNQRKLKAQRDRGDSEDELEEVVVEPKIKLIMKAKGMEPVKLQVASRTTIGKLAGVFRAQRDVPHGKEITLHFDGEKLDQQSTVKDADLEPMDSLEVHIQ